MDLNWICPFCDKHNPSTASHCRHCGAEKTDFAQEYESAGAADASGAADAAFGAAPGFAPDAVEPTHFDEEVLVSYAKFVKFCGVAMCILTTLLIIILIVVASASDIPWILLALFPVLIFIAPVVLFLLIFSAFIRVYCNMSLNLHSINRHLLEMKKRM